MSPITSLTDTTALRTMRFIGRHRILNSPLGYPYMRHTRDYEGYVVGKRTSMVVEGFPRSANTYAWYALRQTLEPDYAISGHTHASSNVIQAVNSQLPTMLLIRHPDDAVASLVQLAKGANIYQAYKAYALFHDRCLTVVDRLYVARFEEVVSDFPSVLDHFYSLNNLKWPRFLGTPEDELAIRCAIDSSDRIRGKGRVRESRVARPSNKRLKTAQVITNLTNRQHQARLHALASYSAVTASVKYGPPK